MPLLGDEAGRDCAVTIVVAFHAHPERAAGGGSLAFAQRRQRGHRAGRGRLRGDKAQVRRKPHSVGQLAFEHGRVDDPRELADALLPGREVEPAAGGVALDVHVVHRGRRVFGHRVPDLQPPEQADRHRIERVGTHIFGRARPSGAVALRYKRDVQALARERQRQTAADDPRTAHANIKAFHRPRL